MDKINTTQQRVDQAILTKILLEFDDVTQHQTIASLQRHTLSGLVLTDCQQKDSLTGLKSYLQSIQASGCAKYIKYFKTVS